MMVSRIPPQPSSQGDRHPALGGAASGKCVQVPAGDRLATLSGCAPPRLLRFRRTWTTPPNWRSSKSECAGSLRFSSAKVPNRAPSATWLGHPGWPPHSRNLIVTERRVDCVQPVRKLLLSAKSIRTRRPWSRTYDHCPTHHLDSFAEDACVPCGRRLGRGGTHCVPWSNALGDSNTAILARRRRRFSCCHPGRWCGLVFAHHRWVNLLAGRSIRGTLDLRRT